MVTSLNSNPNIRDIGFNVEQVFVQPITFGATNAVTSLPLGLPANATVVAGLVAISTLADNTSTVYSVGFTDANGANPSAYASAVVLTAGENPFGAALLTATAKARTIPTQITYTLGGAQSTTGGGDLIIRYVCRNPGP